MLCLQMQIYSSKYAYNLDQTSKKETGTAFKTKKIHAIVTNI